MLTKEQYFLTVLQEECAEVAHRASKAIRFGLDERQPNQPYTNAERIVHELIDLTETLDQLGIPAPSPETVAVLSEARRVKLANYLKRAQAEGRVEA